MRSAAAIKIEELHNEPIEQRTVATPAPAVGWEKNITFGGHTAGGINIPGGLRNPVFSDRATRASDSHKPVQGVPVARPAPQPVGWGRKITFGGSTAGGINIPGGLRAPAPKRAVSER
jgi:hypothetical protein